MKMGSNPREATIAPKRASAAPCSGKLCRPAHFSPTQKIRARTPKLPIRLSDMISSERSLSNPPPRPSAVSARPSSCRPPEIRVIDKSASRIAAACGMPMVSAPTRTKTAIAPSKMPMTGKKRDASAREGLLTAGPPGTGIRVRKPKQIWRSSIQSCLRSCPAGPSSGALFGASDWSAIFPLASFGFAGSTAHYITAPRLTRTRNPSEAQFMSGFSSLTEFQAALAGLPGADATAAAAAASVGVNTPP